MGKRFLNKIVALILLFTFYFLVSSLVFAQSIRLGPGIEALPPPSVRLGAPQPIDRSSYWGVPVGGRSTYWGVSAGGGIARITNPLGHIADDIPGLIAYIVNVAKWLAGAIAILAIIFGAYQILFAVGDPEAFKKGKMTIVYAIIGLALVLIADVIVDIINDIVSY